VPSSVFFSKTDGSGNHSPHSVLVCTLHSSPIWWVPLSLIPRRHTHQNSQEAPKAASLVLEKPTVSRARSRLGPTDASPLPSHGRRFRFQRQLTLMSGRGPVSSSWAPVWFGPGTCRAKRAPIYRCGSCHGLLVFDGAVFTGLVFFLPPERGDRRPGALPKNPGRGVPSTYPGSVSRDRRKKLAVRMHANSQPKCVSNRCPEKYWYTAYPARQLR